MTEKDNNKVMIEFNVWDYKNKIWNPSLIDKDDIGRITKFKDGCKLVTKSNPTTLLLKESFEEIKEKFGGILWIK